MKNLLIVLLASLLWLGTSCNSSKKVAETSVAEDDMPMEMKKRSRQGGGDRQAAYQAMVNKLNLSDAQAVKFEEISQKYQEKMQTLRQNSGGNRMAMREQMQSLRTAQTAEVKTVLTGEQFATYEQLIKEQRRGNRQGRGRGR